MIKKWVGRLLLIMNVLLLTGCDLFKRKKSNQEQSGTEPAAMVTQLRGKDNQISEIPFDMAENAYGEPYEVVASKSIFADDEQGEDFLAPNSTLPPIQLAVDIQQDDMINPVSNVPFAVEQEGQVDLSASEVENNKLHIGTLLFDFDVSSCIRSEYQQTLQLIIHNIKNIVALRPETKIIIEGHACNSEGSERYNIELSHKRACTVRKWVIEYTGINPDNISVFGCGTSHLIALGDRGHQAANRRAEVFVVH